MLLRSTILILCLLFSGCKSTMDNVGASPAFDPNAHAAAQLAVGSLFRYYRIFDRAELTEQVSPNFIPDRLAFVRQAEDSYFRARSVAELKFFIDRAFFQGDRLVASIDWKKKSTIRATGQLQLTEGNADLIFAREQDRWRLYQVRGESPFS
ncbi:MAG: hypothetical protein ACOY3K_06825 [Candidatus Omnitrophota bacterium]